ncbi:MAG: LacI family DNA-binding transcriptional regulator [Armatimonadota bacterium]
MISMRQLARLANVSTATVSRALHDDPRVCPDTRERIKALADQHQYLRNTLTQGVLTGRTRMIGLMLPSFQDAPYDQLLKGVLEEAKVHGYHGYVAEEHHSTEQMRTIIDRFVELRADGIICRPGVMAPLPRDLVMRANSYGAAFVGIDLYDTDFPVDQLCCDEDVCAELTLDYLIDLGHRTFAFIGAIGKRHDRGRAHNLQEAMKRRRLSTDFFIEAPSGLLDAALAHTILTDLMKRSTPPTAIIGWNDLIAAPLVQQAHALGIAVPKRLSIIGFGDTMLAKITSPPLTSIDLNFEQRGRQAVRLVIARCQQQSNASSPNECIYTMPRLVKRGSCAPPSFR